jgi:hypothetical protein
VFTCDKLMGGVWLSNDIAPRLERNASICGLTITEGDF